MTKQSPLLPQNWLQFLYLTMDRWFFPTMVSIFTLGILLLTASHPDWSEVRASGGVTGGIYGVIRILRYYGWRISIIPPGKEDIEDDQE